LEVLDLRFFRRGLLVFEHSWIPQSEWQQTCDSRRVKLNCLPHETLIGLAFNKEKQLVQITKNSLYTASIFYITLLEGPLEPSFILNTQSCMSVQLISTGIENSSTSSEFELLDLHVRKEGIGERGLLLEALICDFKNRYDKFSIHGNFNHISDSGKISIECFTRFGFKLNNNELIYTSS